MRDNYIMFDADIHLRPLKTSILGMYKVFEPLECCVKGIWVHPYTIPPANLAPNLGILSHLWSGNDAVSACLRLTSTSDHFIQPCKIYATCLSCWNAVSRAFGCTFIPFQQPSWPQIW